MLELTQEEAEAVLDVLGQVDVGDSFDVYVALLDAVESQA